MLGRREVSLKVEMKIFKDVAFSVLLYDAKEWALTLTEERRHDAFEMCMLGSIGSLLNVRVNWNDFVRNVDIRKKLHQPLVSLKLKRPTLK